MGKRKKYRRRPRASGATAFVVKVGLLCCFLLLINAVLCQLLVISLRGMFPSAFEDLRIIQAIMFFGPILMILVEFWIYDRRVDYLASRSPMDDTADIVQLEPEAKGS